MTRLSQPQTLASPPTLVHSLAGSSLSLESVLMAWRGLWAFGAAAVEPELRGRDARRTAPPLRESLPIREAEPLPPCLWLAWRLTSSDVLHLRGGVVRGVVRWGGAWDGLTRSRRRRDPIAEKTVATGHCMRASEGLGG